MSKLEKSAVEKQTLERLDFGKWVVPSAARLGFADSLLAAGIAEPSGPSPVAARAPPCIRSQRPTLWLVVKTCGLRVRP